MQVPWIVKKGYEPTWHGPQLVIWVAAGNRDVKPGRHSEMTFFEFFIEAHISSTWESLDTNTPSLLDVTTFY